MNTTWKTQLKTEAGHKAKAFNRILEDLAAQRRQRDALVLYFREMWDGRPERAGAAHIWLTPLGIRYARDLVTFGADQSFEQETAWAAANLVNDHPHDHEVTHAIAAAMLGLKRGTIATMVDRGTLERTPNGKVRRLSVLAYLVRRENIAQDSTIEGMTKHDANPSTTVEECAEDFVRVNNPTLDTWTPEVRQWVERIAKHIRNDWDGSPETLTDLACEVA